MRSCALVILGQAATVLVTWPLWAARTSGPPMLPLSALPAIDFGPILLGTLALAWLRPRTGAMLHALALALAIAADQTRLQPSTISLAVLLLALASRRRTLAPAHLAGLWFWAGAHKLLAGGFAVTATALFGDASVGAAVACAEIGLGVLVLFPRARGVTAVGALILHAGLAIGLLSRGELALVPWNLVLAAAGLLLPRARARSLDLAFLIVPLGFYFGFTDAYVANALYTGDVWRSVRCTEAACVSDVARADTVAAFGVPLEPEPRLLRAHFDATCVPGEELMLTPPSFAPSPGVTLCPER